CCFSVRLYAATEYHSLHDALPISRIEEGNIDLNRTHFDLRLLAEEVMEEAGLISAKHQLQIVGCEGVQLYADVEKMRQVQINLRSEEHTSELQSRENIVCRLLLEK